MIDASSDAAASDAIMDSPTANVDADADRDVGDVDAAPCPGTEVDTLGAPPPNDVHCFDDLHCAPPLVQVGCAETCNGNTSCIDAGQTWYVTLTCACSGR